MCEVLAFKTGMGSGGTLGSIVGVYEAIEEIKPDCIIQVGIAFGLQKGKQNLCDILVSRQICCYELQKITGTKRISRGDKITASPLLIDRFEASSVSWTKCKVHFGLILSGEKLVNSASFRKQLKEMEEEAIGGEMEGAGMVASASKMIKEWILVKGVSDWGVSKGDKYQEKAAENAMEFVFYTLNSTIY